MTKWTEGEPSSEFSILRERVSRMTRHKVDLGKDEKRVSEVC